MFCKHLDNAHLPVLYSLPFKDYVSRFICMDGTSYSTKITTQRRIRYCDEDQTTVRGSTIEMVEEVL